MTVSFKSHPRKSTLSPSISGGTVLLLRLTYLVLVCPKFYVNFLSLILYLLWRGGRQRGEQKERREEREGEGEWERGLGELGGKRGVGKGEKEGRRKTNTVRYRLDVKSFSKDCLPFHLREGVKRDRSVKKNNRRKTCEVMGKRKYISNSPLLLRD